MSWRVSHQLDCLRDNPQPDATGAVMLELFAELLEQGVSVRVQVTGRSMQPRLQSGDTVRIEPVGTIFTGDVVLFRNAEGLPVLHRVIQKYVDRNGYTMIVAKGDALALPDPPVSCNAVFGRVCHVEHCMGGVSDYTTCRRRVANRLLAAFSYCQVAMCRGRHLAASLCRRRPIISL